MNYFTSGKRAFTLIELLVVVAIIVILIAILVPALSQALYMATLTECGANMDGFGTAVITYAHANKDRYPYREALNVTYLKDEGSPLYFYYSAKMGLLKYAQDNNDPDPTFAVGNFDDRALWGTVVDMDKTFQDPFVDKINLLHPDSKQPDDMVISSIDIMTGWGWNGEGRNEKLGTRMTWTAPGGHPDAGKIFSWDLLMMDRDVQFPDYVAYDEDVGNPNPDLDEFEPAFTSHPETHGTATLQHYSVEDAYNSDRGHRLWVSQFMVEGPRDNFVDRNFLRSDGSVETLDDVYAGAGMILTTSRRDPVKFPGPNGQVAEDERMIVLPADSHWDNEAGGSVLMPRK